jgi:hypothetical protein
MSLVEKIKGLINNVKSNEDIKLASEETEDLEIGKMYSKNKYEKLGYKLIEEGDERFISNDNKKYEVNMIKDLDHSVLINKQASTETPPLSAYVNHRDKVIIARMEAKKAEFVSKPKQHPYSIKVTEKGNVEKKTIDTIIDWGLALETAKDIASKGKYELVEIWNGNNELVWKVWSEDMKNASLKVGEVIKEVPGGSDKVQNEPVNMGGEPDKIKKFKKEQKNDKDGDKPDVVIEDGKKVEKKESIQKTAEEKAHDIAFDKIVNEIKSGVPVDVAIENTKETFGSEPVIINQEEQPIVIKQESIKQKFGSYNIIEKDNGEVVCLKDGEFSVN